MTNIVFVAACMVLLGDFNWKKKGTLVRFICQFLICWLWTVLFDTVYYAITKGVGQHHKLKKKMERNLFAGSFHCVKI